MAEEEVDFIDPSRLHLVSAFLAMEPPDLLISLARVCGGGSISERVQGFIWEHCLSKADGKHHAPYLRSFLKKLIVEVESTGAYVLDELYERYASYMTSLKDDDSTKGNSRVLKWVSFLLTDDSLGAPTCQKPRKLVIPLQCSLNMFEGDTGCSIWPSSLFLSEFILSCPEIFSSKCCFEVGSGVGLVGICLAHVKASKVILSDGDLSSLANMKLNLELNQLSTRTDWLERTTQDPNLIQCIYLPWESAQESELQDFMPDIVLGADVIYDPSCLPHLIQVLAVLLNRENSYTHDEVHGDGYNHGVDACEGKKAICTATPNHEFPFHALKEGPVAYIAYAVRNIDTFNCFLTLADQANLTVTDLTDKIKRFELLPYMLSYQQSNAKSHPKHVLGGLMKLLSLGADIIYDPSCLPHLIRVLAILLNREKSYTPGEVYGDGYSHGVNACEGKKAICPATPNPTFPFHAYKEGPVAYIASVIRNIDTFNCFLTLADQANLTVTDLTYKIKRFGLLPYMLSYQQLNVRLLSVSYSCQ